MTIPSLSHLEQQLRTTADRILNHASRDTSIKEDGSFLTATDTAMQQAVCTLLEQLTPDIPLLGEEMSLQQQQAVFRHGGACWVLDPIDGTTNFSVGLPFYCISLALVEDSKTRLGLVYDPCRNECFTAERGVGAWLNGEPMPTSPPRTLASTIGLIDLKRLPAELTRHLIETSPCHSMRNLGAIALEWCWLAAGRGQVYLHGRQQLWDYAAAQLILMETGGRAADLDGNSVEPLELGSKGIVAATNADLFKEWFDWIKAHNINCNE